jgi:hypothetical protein
MGESSKVLYVGLDVHKDSRDRRTAWLSSSVSRFTIAPAPARAT